MAKLRMIQYVKNTGQSSLPTTYEELEYVKCVGTSLFDTGLTFGGINDVKMKINIQSYPTGGSGVVFGANASSNEVLLWYSGGGQVYLNGTQLTLATELHQINTDYEVDFNITDGAASLTINDTLAGTSTGSSTDKKCLLFSALGNASATTGDVLEYYCLYYCKIYNTTNTLVREYIPAKRRSDQSIGLYDKVNTTFYSVAGLIAGPSYSATYTSLIGKKSGTEPVVPSGYTQLEYITGNGTQYIDTGFAPNQDTKVDADFSFSQLNSNALYFGTSSSWETASFGFYLGGSGIRYSNYNSDTEISSYFVPILNTKYNYVHNKNNIYVDNNLIYTYTSQTFQSTGNLYIGHTVISGYESRFNFKGNIYHFALYDNGTLIRDMYPAKNSSDVVGMYDIVNDMFYDSDGTSAFIAGPEQKAEYADLRVIETEE